jgi:tRNA threonylcarbamoyl adenosine modification protein (Sua5/YciO/YrdC/YwlC family)
LTLVVEHAPSLIWDLGDAAGTVAIRMPLHPVALEVLNATGPMAVSSANVSGSPPATTAAEAREQLGESVEVYLEAGDCGEPIASTIVDLTGAVPRLLRAGAVSAQELREVVPDLIVPGEEARGEDVPGEGVPGEEARGEGAPGDGVAGAERVQA